MTKSHLTIDDIKPYGKNAKKAPGRAIRTTGQMRADGGMAHPSFELTNKEQ